MNTLLFVYGTLKRGCSNHAHLAGQTYVGPARTGPGFQLFDLGGVPGLYPAPGDNGRVLGEVWSVDAAALARLDAFEGVPEGLYQRVAVPLQAPFATTNVEAYLPQAPAPRRPPLGAEWHE